jgi:hypothetical protein
MVRRLGNGSGWCIDKVEAQILESEVDCAMDTEAPAGSRLYLGPLQLVPTSVAIVWPLKGGIPLIELTAMS